MTGLCVFYLVIWMAAAAIIPETHQQRNLVADEHINLRFKVGEQTTQEDVELNYLKNFVRLQTPALEGSSDMVLIHDYNKGLTLVQCSGMCFLVDRYGGLPASLEDWDWIRKRSGLQTLQSPSTLEQFRSLPLALNRTHLPEIMQQDCDEIQVLILEETYQGEEADQRIQEAKQNPNNSLGSIYLPIVIPSGVSGKLRLARKVDESTELTLGFFLKGLNGPPGPQS